VRRYLLPEATFTIFHKTSKSLLVLMFYRNKKLHNRRPSKNIHSKRLSCHNPVTSQTSGRWISRRPWRWNEPRRDDGVYNKHRAYITEDDQAPNSLNTAKVVIDGAKPSLSRRQSAATRHSYATLHRGNSVSTPRKTGSHDQRAGELPGSAGTISGWFH
jgi:hypothetical protein